MPREAELLEVAAHGLGRDPRVAQRGDGCSLGPLRQLLAVLAEDQSVVDELRHRRTERLEEATMQRLVRPMVVAANDVTRFIVGDRASVGRHLVVRSAMTSPKSLPRCWRWPPGGGHAARSGAPGPSQPSSASEVAHQLLLPPGRFPRRIGVDSQGGWSPNLRLATALRVADVQRARRAGASERASWRGIYRAPDAVVRRSRQRRIRREYAVELSGR
jgi:hypothetical protein